MAGHGTQCQSEGTSIIRDSSPVFKILPNALQMICGYSLRSRRRVTSLVMYRQESEDEEVVGDEMAAKRLGPIDGSEISGICWKFAHHGLNTLQTSLAESQSSDAQSQTFSRQLYLDAMAYLIQGLPSDLTDQEKLHLKTTLPESLKDSTPPETTQPRKRKSSLLHRGLASTINAICLIIRLALPCVKLFIAMAYSYDRAHHIRERVFAFSITAANSFGKRSMALASTAMANEIVLRAVTYWVDGIRGGLNEGLGEGLKVIEAQNEP